MASRAVAVVHPVAFPGAPVRYMPELDGLRAVSVTLVVASHLLTPFIPGLFGVTVFFFISGYLITGQLLAELDQSGRINLPAFWLRRVLRLYPALIVAVLAGVGLVTALGGTVASGDVAAALFYAVNLREYVQILPEPLPGVPHPFSVLWSLAVEEHFYLLFPPLVWLLARRRAGFTAALAGLAVACAAWQVHMAGICAAGGCTMLRIEHGTDTRFDSIAFGAILAACLASPMHDAVLRLLRSRVFAGLGCALLVAALLVRDEWFRQTVRFSAQGVGLFFVVGAVRFAPWATEARRMLSLPALVLLGRWSYSLYLWHWIVLAGAAAVAPGAGGIVLLAASFAAAALSYYAVEQPMLRVRRLAGSHAAG